MESTLKLKLSNLFHLQHKSKCMHEISISQLMNMFSTVAQPPTHCATEHPVVQWVIPLRNRIRFLPHSKPLVGTEFLLCEVIWPLHVKMQRKAYPTPFDEKHTRISVYLAKFNIIARELHVQLHHQVDFNLHVVLHFQVRSFRPSACLTRSFQLAQLYNWVAVRLSGCTTG